MAEIFNSSTLGEKRRNEFQNLRFGRENRRNASLKPFENIINLVV